MTAPPPPPPPPTPGIFTVSAKITNPSLTATRLKKWYDEVHFRDITATSGMTTALRYDVVGFSAATPAEPLSACFCAYPVRDLAFLLSDEFMRIPVSSDLLPGPGRSVFESARFDTRYYELVQVLEPEGARAGPGALLISAAMTPAPGADADLDAWYREEHLAAIAKYPGHRRTRRYKLAAAMQTAVQAMMPGARKELPPTWLAMHEFDGEDFPSEELLRSPQTEWAKRVLAGLSVHEYGVYRFVSGVGDLEFAF